MRSKTIFLVFALFIGNIIFISSADDRQPVKKTDENRELPTSPLSVGEDIIWYEYDHVSGVSHFLLPSNVSYMMFTMTEQSSGITYFGEVSSSKSNWVQSLPTGLYYLSCTTQDGKVYSGPIYI